MYGTLLSSAYILRRKGRILRELTRTQWLPSKKIRDIQLKKLRALLEHCYKTVPFYHRAMKERGVRAQDIRSPEDLCRLPIVRKQDIRMNPTLFRSLDIPRDAFEATTSGSTGEPFRFLRSRNTFDWEVAGTFRMYGWTGYRLGDRWVHIHPRDDSGPLRQRLSVVRKDLLFRRLRVDDFKISPEEMRMAAKRISSFKPFLIECSPIRLLEFGRYAQEVDASVPALVSTEQRIFPFERRLAADRWRGEVYDSYGSTEAMAMASECHEHTGLHVSDELYVLEIVKDGEHVSPDEIGRILVTSLYHRAQPFVRYDTGDLSMPMDQDCPCGRGLSLMSTVEGRYVDVLESEEGRLIFASGFSNWFADVEVRQFQIEQLGRTRLIIRIIPEEGYTEASGETIVARTRAVLGQRVEVEIRRVDAIPDYKSGKRHVVKSRVQFPTSA